MNVETQRRNIVHRILDLSDSKLLNTIEALLDNDVYTYSTSGNPLSVKQVKNHLDTIIIASDNGEKGFSTDEAKGKIIRK